MTKDKEQFVLQNFVIETSVDPDRSMLYFRRTDAQDDAEPFQSIRIGREKTIDFITYFNAFSLRKWQSLTSLEAITLRIRGRSRVRLKMCTVDTAARINVVSEQVYSLSAEDTFVDLPNASLLSGELLGVVATGLDEHSEISGAEWITCEEPLREVRLAIIITTFNRPEAITSAYEKTTRLIARTKPQYAIDLFIIDNGQNVSLHPHPNVTVVANGNFGGSGGFARGLMEACRTGKYTHCLFMDDDASCEPESILRTSALLARTQDWRVSIAGAMLLSSDPCIQAEKGASFAVNAAYPWYFIAQNANRDVSRLEQIASNDLPDQSNYGGWWYFAFPIKAVKYYPFPFFVRGDDVDFAIVNELPIVTLNGVATWCEAFSEKFVAPIEFLACRAWMALLLKHSDLKTTQTNLRRLLRYLFEFGVRYDYASLEAGLAGLEFSLRGPDVFAADPAPLAWLRRLRSLRRETVIAESVVHQASPLLDFRRDQSAWLQLTSLATIRGHLLPARLDTIASARAYDFEGLPLNRSKSSVWREAKGWVRLKRDRRRMAAALVKWLLLYFVSQRRLETARKVWGYKSLKYQSFSFWHAWIYKEGSPKVGSR